MDNSLSYADIIQNTLQAATKEQPRIQPIHFYPVCDRDSGQRPIMPDPSVDSRLIGNLRRARKDFEEVDLQLEELVAKCDEVIRQQKLRRIQAKTSFIDRLKT